MHTTYTVNDSGMTHVEEQVSIKNLSEYMYTPSYSVNLGMKNTSNVQVKGEDGAIPFKLSTSDDDNERIDVTFAKQYVGLDKINTFTISFDTSQVAIKRGSVWEVDIPGVLDGTSFADLVTTIYVPKDFGSPAVVKPTYTKAFTNPMTFSQQDIGPAGIYMLFGNAQVYSYSLTYHISNPNLFPIKTEIALPPSTNYQNVLVNSINPPPVDVYQDSDGNWLAQYELPASAKRDIVAKGQINVSSVPQPEILSSQARSMYLKSQQYWESEDPLIQSTAQKLKTPRDIYDYVVDHLTYNYNKISVQNDRLGAKKALLDPTDAVCLEFTDLFVALARAKGIPARAVEGYAYTTDDKYRPRSLVKDILHAWPEYYDDTKKTWVMVDPTWGNTTQGLDYFDSLDFDHIAFVINGVSSTYPIPAGGYKFDDNSQDVSVQFADNNQFLPKSQAVMTSVIPAQVLSAFPFTGKIMVQNTGNIPIQNKTVQIQSEIPIQQSNYTIDSIPPFGHKTFTVAFSKTPLLTNKKFRVTMLFDGVSQSKIIQVNIFPLYGLVLLGGGVCAAIIISIFAFKSRRLSLQK